MKIYLLLFAIISIPSISVFSQDTKTGENKEAAYTLAINTRAEKIVATLGITDPAKATRVKDIIAGQYRNLSDIQSPRDAKIKEAKLSGGDKESINAQTAKLTDEADNQIAELHKKYLSDLSKELTSAQIDKVKDGMTYDVVHVTYNGYMQMIPTLTEKQKEQIMTWLVEAREHAMDAESSDKKHAWFGKYKGRINNYLSAQGYDLKKEGEDWQKRIEDAKTKPAK